MSKQNLSEAKDLEEAWSMNENENSPGKEKI